MSRSRAAGIAALAMVVLSPVRAGAQQGPAPAVPHPARTANIGDGVTARLEGTRLLIGAVAEAGEDWDALAARTLSDPAQGPALEAALGGALEAGRVVDLPLRLWPAGLGARALLALFPGDSVTAAEWRHVVTPGATPWSLSVLFTGSGRNHAQLRDAKGSVPNCRVGDIVVIDASILRPELRVDGRPVAAPAAPATARDDAPASAGPGEDAGAPKATAIRGSGSALELVVDLARRALRAAEQVESPEPAGSPDGGSEKPEDDAGTTPAEEPLSADAALTSTLFDECAPIDDEAAEAGESRASDEPDFVPRIGARSDDGLLRYGSDESGAFGVYELRAGETLYTHVVLRFTGILSGRDVNVAAQRIAKRSRIDDVTDIAVGTAVRIPLADLLPQFLPEEHPRRQQWEVEQAESGRLARRERRRNLAGVHVIVDSGHGGLDPGAGNGIAWEDDHAYDIACRVMAVLAERTHAAVHPLVRDRSSGHAPLARLRRDTDEELLTTPPTRLDGVPTRVAVNLRWMMANDLRRKLAATGVADERVVFLSIHADSLHESATGAMAYFPSAKLRAPDCGVPAEPAYRRVAEASDRNAFSMTRREALRAEGLSRELGESIISRVRAAKLGVHGFGPVRGSIQRGGLMLPAVLKYNRVPASVLIEACNLNNPTDQRSLRDPVFRQKLAEAIVEGLVMYFDGQDAPHQKSGGRR